MNSQPWAFVVIQNRELLKKICEDAKSFLLKDPHWNSHSEHAKGPLSDPKFDIFYGATTLIVICSAKTGFSPAEDCYLAAENLMLAACGMGLGTCPIGFARDVLRTEKYRQTLNIGSEYDPVLPIIVGHPEGVPAIPERRAPEILSWQK